MSLTKSWTWGERAQLLQKLEKNMAEMLGTVSQLAGSFVDHGYDVPLEIAQIMGEIDRRQRHFKKVCQSLRDPTGAKQTKAKKDVILRYISNLQTYSSNVEDLLGKLLLITTTQDARDKNKATKKDAR